MVNSDNNRFILALLNIYIYSNQIFRTVKIWEKLKNSEKLIISI